MTGKEALDYIKVNTRYRYVGWHVNHIEEVRKDLEELDKYKRAFEILKDNINMELICSNHDFLCKPVYALDVYANKQIELTKEEYELLEELMKGESSI